MAPWKALGRKWHFSRKGFPPGKRPKWDMELLEELCETLVETDPDGQFLWNNQQLVHFCEKNSSRLWASLLTKKLDFVELRLTGPKGKFPLGSIIDLAAEREVISDRDDCDSIRLRFKSMDDLTKGDLKGFLAEHLEAVNEAAAAGVSWG